MGLRVGCARVGPARCARRWRCCPLRRQAQPLPPARSWRRSCGGSRPTLRGRPTCTSAALQATPFSRYDPDVLFQVRSRRPYPGETRHHFQVRSRRHFLGAGAQRTLLFPIFLPPPLSSCASPSSFLSSSAAAPEFNFIELVILFPFKFLSSDSFFYLKGSPYAQATAYEKR